jgi:hypothetical protein
VPSSSATNSFNERFIQTSAARGVREHPVIPGRCGLEDRADQPVNLSETPAGHTPRRFIPLAGNVRLISLRNQTAPSPAASGPAHSYPLVLAPVAF